MIKVYHFDTDTDNLTNDDRYNVIIGEADVCKRLFNSGAYVHVANVDTLDLNFAFRQTNNVDTSWSMEPHKNVKIIGLGSHELAGIQYGYKSSSVGDIFVSSDGRTFIVARRGFEQI